MVFGALLCRVEDSSSRYLKYNKDFSMVSISIKSWPFVEPTCSIFI